MSTVDLIAERARGLPAETQQEILDFVEFLRSRAPQRGPLRSMCGLWRGFDVAPEDIDEVRREMWSTFPREDI